MQQTVPLQDSPRVSVNYKDGVFARVEQDGIGGLWADTVNCQELFAEDGSGRAKKFAQRTPVVLMEKGDKFFEFAGLLSKITGGSDQRGEFGDRDTTESRGGKQTIAAQGDNGALNVSPSGVLGEDGADDDFEAGPCGPPFLRSVGSKEGARNTLAEAGEGVACVVTGER